MGGKSKTWLLLLILIIATFLRLYQIKSIPPGLYPDEAVDGNNAIEALRGVPPTGGFKVFYPENNGREGLFMNIQAIFLKFSGVNEPWVLRLPSAIFGILTVLGIYFLAAELFSKKIGLLSAFFLATNFWHINFSRISFRAILAPLLLTWSIYFLILGFNKLRGGGNFRQATFYHLTCGIIYGLGFYTYIAYRVSPLLVLLILYFYWIKSRDEGWFKNFLHSTLHFLIFSFLVALPLGIYFLKNPADFLGRTSQISIFSSASPIKDLTLNIIKTLGMFNFRGDYNWRHNFSGRPELFWPVGILFTIGLVCSLRKIREFEFQILLAWFALTALPVVISNEGIPHALRAILTIPPVIIFAAVGGVWLYENIKGRIAPRFLGVVIVVFFIVLVAQSYSAYFIDWSGNPNTYGAFSADYVELGHALNQLPPETPKYVVIQASGVNVRGIPMPAQTVMFITDTFLPSDQQAKNIHYVLPAQEQSIPYGSLKFYIK